MSQIFKPCDTCDGEGTVELPVVTFRCDPTSEVKSIRCYECDGEKMTTAYCQIPGCWEYAEVDCLLHPDPDGHYDERYLCAHHHAEWLSGFDDDTAADVALAETNFLPREAQQ
jgi:hypothetical protein